jgi:hypothetical protein
MNLEDSKIVGKVIRSEITKLRETLEARIQAVEAVKMIPGPAGPQGEKGLPGEPGASVRGESGINGKDGADGINGKDGQNGADGKDGRDGRDGHDGRDGADAFELSIAEGIDSEKTYPRGALATDKGALWRFDGVEWKCLVDGLAGVELEFIDSRTIEVKQIFASGKSKAVKYPVPTIEYKEIHKAGESYTPGDFVTYNGSVWACIKSTTATPGTKDSGWRLAVKRGLNGRSK